jgi:hypothetical protein
LLQAAGFTLPDLRTRYLPGPRPMTFHYWGVAHPHPLPNQTTGRG